LYVGGAVVRPGELSFGNAGGCDFQVIGRPGSGVNGVVRIEGVVPSVFAGEQQQQGNRGNRELEKLKQCSNFNHVGATGEILGKWEGKNTEKTAPVC